MAESSNELPFAKAISLANSLSVAPNRSQQQTKLARKLYMQCLAAQPDDFETRANYALLEMEIYEIEQKQTSKDCQSDCTTNAKQVIEYFEQALVHNDSWWQGHYNVANIYMELGPEGEAKAIAHLEKAAATCDTDGDVFNNLSVVLMNTGQLQESLEYAKKAIRLDKNNINFQLNIAELYSQIGDVKKALFFGRKCAQQSSKSNATGTTIQALKLLSSLHEKLDDTQNSILCLKDAIDTGLRSNMLCLPERIRYYSAVSDPDIASAILEESKQTYEKHYPNDKLGTLLFDLLLKNLTPGQATQRISECLEQEELSYACEAFLLNLRLENPKQLAHKCIIADNIKDAGYSDIAPKTIICSGPGEVYSNVTSSSNLWFLKDPSVQRGQGILILNPSTCTLKQIESWMQRGKRYCLQQCIEPLLLDERKFGIRLHVLVLANVRRQRTLSIFLLLDGILTKCGKKYDPKDVSALNQITCTSVQRAEKDFDRSQIKTCASDWDGYAETIPYLEEVVNKTIMCVSRKLRSATETEPEGSIIKGQLFGYDFVYNTQGKPIFIEANMAPQFQDAKIIDSLRYSVAYPLINKLPFILFSNLLDAEDETKLIHGWKHLRDIELTN